MARSKRLRKKLSNRGIDLKKVGNRNIRMINQNNKTKKIKKKKKKKIERTRSFKERAYEIPGVDYAEESK
jgi:hypothetical protein